MQALINLNNKVNTMTLTYVFKLNLKIYFINIKTQKIDSSIFNTFEIVLANFLVKNKLKKACFFKKLFYWPIPV